MNKGRIKTFKLLSIHLFIGGLATILFFGLTNEIPNRHYLLERLHIWLTIPIGLALSTWFCSKLIYNQLTKRNRKTYWLAFGFIFFSWTVVFLLTAIIDGVFETIRSRQFEVVDALTGYIIYRLWFYWGVGFIHGMTGGILLALDLQKFRKRELVAV